MSEERRWTIHFHAQPIFNSPKWVTRLEGPVVGDLDAVEVVPASTLKAETEKREELEGALRKANEEFDRRAELARARGNEDGRVAFNFASAHAAHLLRSALSQEEQG